MKSFYLLLTIAVLAIFMAPHETQAQVVNLISPTDGEQVEVNDLGRVYFNFILSGYDVDHYSIQVATDPGFDPSDIVETDWFVHSEYKMFYLERRIKYYWRAKAHYHPTPSSDPIYSGWSVTNDFIVIVPALLSPPDGAINQIQPLVLEWRPIIEGLIVNAGHQLWVDDDADFSSPEIDINTNGSQRTVTGLDYDTKYYWKVRYYFKQITFPQGTIYYDWSVTREFTTCDVPATPVLLLPNSSATVAQPVTITWSTINDADEYNIQITTIPGFSSNVVDEVVGSASYSASGLEDNTAHYWRVRAGNECGWSNFSLDRVFTTECSEPDPPGLISPLNAATGISMPFTLDWKDAVDFNWYRVAVDNNSNFSSPEIYEELLVSEFVVSSGLTPGEIYYWRAMVHNDCGTSTWCLKRSFTMECPIPDPPILELPADGATDVSQPVTWDWNDVSGASKYHIQVDNDNTDFKSLVVDNDSRISSDFTWDGLMDATDYYWRVRSGNDCGWSDWSDHRDFTTDTQTDVTEIPSGELPSEFTLSQNYPNPFNPTTNIDFNLPRAAYVRIEVFNILGNSVSTLVDEYLSAGYKSVEWDGRSNSGQVVSSGVYLFRITAGEFSTSRKALLLK
jgi:flagellar hook capping protein FlgD